MIYTSPEKGTSLEKAGETQKYVAGLIGESLSLYEAVAKTGGGVFLCSNVWIPTQRYKAHEETGKYDPIRGIKNISRN